MGEETPVSQADSKPPQQEQQQQPSSADVVAVKSVEVVTPSASATEGAGAGAEAAESSGKPLKKVHILGVPVTFSESKARKALVGASVFLIALNGVGLPFALPKLKQFLGAPYVPMKRRVVEALFDDVLPVWAKASRRPLPATTVEGHVPPPLAGVKLVDFGSGDGRIVRAAAARGMHAIGYEMNPYLAFWSKFRGCFSRTVAPGVGEVRWANAWSADLSKTDVVTVYGRPGDGLMERVAGKCARELPGHAAVVSHHFALPGWEHLLICEKHGLKLYHMSRRARGSE